MTSHPPLDSTIARLSSVLTAAHASEPEWPLQIRASLAALLDFFAAEPELARLLSNETFVGGPSVSHRYREEMGRLVPYLRQGRELSIEAADFPETTERGLIGSIASQVGRKVSSGEAEELPKLLFDLTQFALSPYLGAAEARRVARLDAA